MAKMQSSFGNIIHSAGGRYRIKGNGFLQTRLLNMGNIEDGEISLRYIDLDPINMNLNNNRNKTVIANFQDQGIQLQFRTTHINEVFNISNIVIFTKPVAEGYPIIAGAI